MDRYGTFSIPTSVIEAYVQIFKSIALCARTQSCLPQTDTRTDGRTDKHSSTVLEFCADQMSPRNIGSQIIISRCYKRIDKTNIPSLRRDRIECNQPREVISYGGPAQVDEKRRCFLVPRHRNGESCMLLVRAVSLEDFKTKQKNKLR